MKIIFFILLFFFNNISYAQEEQSSNQSLFKNMGKDFISPVTTKAKYVFYAGTALTILLAALEDHISDPVQTDIVEDHPLGRASHIGNLAGQMYPNLLYMLGMWAHGSLAGQSRSYARASHMFKTTFYSSALTTMLKYSVREPRPLGNNREAFPSGHTTTAYAFASVIGTEHDWPYGLAAYTMATFAAISRMNDNQHLLHQVVGGATIGLSYGLSLYYRSLQRDELQSESSILNPQTVVQILPTDRLDGAMLVLGTEF